MSATGMHEYHNSIRVLLNYPFPTTSLPNVEAFADLWKNHPARVKPRLDPSALPKLGRLTTSDLSVPFYENRVSAGYPSDADDSLDAPLNLTKYLIREEKTSYYFTATDYSMIEAGIFHNDILVIDCFLEPKHGCIVIAVVNGEFIVRRLYKDNDQMRLLPANPDYPAITVSKEMSFFIQGVVTSVIHQFKPLSE